jgi:hypothetical protein
VTKYAIITTTINIPFLIRDYAADAKLNGHAELKFIVAGDRKTPGKTAKFCKEVEFEFGYPVEYMTPEDQDLYLKDKQELSAHIPWNSIQRRNVAILKAWEEGFDVIITIDDDNFLYSKNYLGSHRQVGRNVQIDAWTNETRWLNICDFIEDTNGRDFFPRGFAVSERSNSKVPATSRSIKAKVVVNGGLWLGDPDIDAVTRLAGPIDAVRYTRNDNFALDFDVWCPFNSQNTALSREVIPSYFLSPFVGRYDDIWASYFVKRISNHLGDVISFGLPLIKQNRNEHDLWHDMDLERMGLQLTELFCESLDTATLKGSNYLQCSEELVEHLETSFETSDILDGYKDNLRKFTTGYKIWIRTVERTAG